MKTEQILINGQLISYLVAGNKLAKPLVLLHGWRSSAAVWTEVIAGLGDNFAIYALDLPGFGGSANPGKPFSVGDYSDTVAGFIDKMELTGASVIGHSVGGRIAIKLAAGHPELVRSLVLVDSAGFVTDEGKKRLFGQIAVLFRPFFKPKFMQGARKTIYKLIGADDYVETPELVETFKLVVSEDLTPFLAQIKCPTLLVWGEKDMETPISFARKMNEGIAGSKLVILSGAGHFSFLDKCDDFIREIKGFYEKI